MSTEPAQEYGDEPVAGEGLHFVMKRGHHGRYRFAVIGGGDRITGEVRVDVAGADRDELRLIALARIASLATGLLGIVVARLSAERENEARVQRPEPVLEAERVSRAGGRAAAERDHHGQV